MKYLSKEISEYLVSLGCVSESGKDHRYVQSKTGKLQLFHACDYEQWLNDTLRPNMWPVAIPAFSFEDLLRKDNAEKIWLGVERERTKDEFERKSGYHVIQPKEWQIETKKVLEIFQSHPDTWPEEIEKLIKL